MTGTPNEAAAAIAGCWICGGACNSGVSWRLAGPAAAKWYIWPMLKRTACAAATLLAGGAERGGGGPVVVVAGCMLAALLTAAATTCCTAAA